MALHAGLLLLVLQFT